MVMALSDDSITWAMSSRVGPAPLRERFERVKANVFLQFLPLCEDRARHHLEKKVRIQKNLGSLKP